MMNHRLSILRMLVGLAVIGCAPSTTGPWPDGFTLSHGTSFGMCLGHCIVVMDITGATVTITESSHFPATYPTRSSSTTLSPNEAARLERLARQAGLQSVAGVHGCPDCADGGAEWVEVRAPGDTVRATFEYGRVLTPIAELQTELRALRSRLQGG
jgi:hypothetical protein